jgi:hypothetical protein
VEIDSDGGGEAQCGALFCRAGRHIWASVRKYFCKLQVSADLRAIKTGRSTFRRGLSWGPSADLRTVTCRDEDTPTWADTGLISRDPVYSEKLDIGYRWYDAKKIAPLFEFGYGLSYTHFTYSDLSVKRDTDRTLHVSFFVKNDGALAGAEVPQIYLGVDYAGEPPRQLGGWRKIHLKPGEATGRYHGFPEDTKYLGHICQ